MPKINKEEYEVLKGLDGEWNWITRIEEGAMKSFISKPFKNMDFGRSGSWDIKGNENHAIYTTYSDLFHFIQWEDEEPYEIAGLIREYEIKELRLAPSGTVIVDSFDESEETVMKKDIEWLKSWFDDDKSYTGEYVKFKINHCRGADEAEEEPKYYAKLKEVRPPEKEWLTNLTGPNYYVIDTKGLRLGEFILDLVGLKTEASTHTLKDWERYGINDSNANFVEVAE